MPGSLSSALMTFGLNLLAQPGGNLAGAIGKLGSALENSKSKKQKIRQKKCKTKKK